MRIYTNGRSTGIGMGPIGWLVLGPILLPVWLVSEGIRALARSQRR